MGDCYFVTLEAKLLDEKKACDALRQLISSKGPDGRTNYNLDEYAKQGVTPDTFDGLISIFFAGWEGQRVSIERCSDGWVTYKNCFNASYGWGWVLQAMIETLTPFLAHGSAFYVDADETYIDCEVEGDELKSNTLAADELVKAINAHKELSADFIHGLIEVWKVDDAPLGKEHIGDYIERIVGKDIWSRLTIVNFDESSDMGSFDFHK